ncbi:MAG: hypothetical protein QOG99_1764 [Frankiales bacterium]|nr:hypothetical protein [Frankiales bacterium]
MSMVAERVHAARPPMVGQALGSVLLGGVLLALAYLDENALLGGVALVQVLCVLGFLAVAEAPAAVGVFGIAMAAAVAADVTVVLDDGRVRYLAGVLGLALVLGLLHQLARRDRSRVTESLADTLVAVTLVTAAAGLAAAARTPHGTWPLRTALAAAAAALVAGRVGDLVIHRPALAIGSTRAWPGLLLALGTGVAAAVVVAAQDAQDHLATDQAALLGLTAAAAVAATDLLLDLAAAELTSDETRRVAALRPTSLFVPFALLGPVVLAAVRLLER